MAIGDAAAAAGLSVVSPTADARLGYQDINKRGDELAQHLTAGTHDVSKITNLRSDNVPRPSGLGTVEGGFVTLSDAYTAVAVRAGALESASALAVHNINNLAGRMVAVESGSGSSGKANSYAGNVNAVAYAAAALTPGTTRTNRAVWMDAGGNLGQNTSSRRYKAEVRPAEVSTADVLALDPVTFRYRTNVTDDQSRQLGLIAEDVPEALAPFLVIEDAEGRPDGVRYESTLPVLLLAVVKELEARITTLEENA